MPTGRSPSSDTDHFRRFPRLELQDAATKRVPLDLATETGQRATPLPAQARCSNASVVQTNAVDCVGAGASGLVLDQGGPLSAHVGEEEIGNGHMGHGVPRGPNATLVPLPDLDSARRIQVPADRIGKRRLGAEREQEVRPIVRSPGCNRLIGNRSGLEFPAATHGGAEQITRDFQFLRFRRTEVKEVVGRRKRSRSRHRPRARARWSARNL